MKEERVASLPNKIERLGGRMTRREDNVISSHNQPTHPVPSHPIPIEQSKATHTCSAATRHNATTRGKAQQSKLPLHPSTQQSRPTTNSRLLPAYTNWPPNIPPTFPHFIQLGRTKVVDKRSGMPFKDTKSAPHHRAPSSQGIQGTPPRQEAKRQKDKKNTHQPFNWPRQSLTSGGQPIRGRHLVLVVFLLVNSCRPLGNCDHLIHD